MLTEKETEHERLAVFGVSECMFVCEKGKKWVSGDGGGGGQNGTNAKGKAAIKAQSTHPLPPISV